MKRNLHHMARLTLLLSFAMPFVARAQQAEDSIASQPAKENKFSIDVDMLTRGEMRNGGLPTEETGEDLAAFIVERTLIGMSYERDKLSTRVTAQHSGTWGSKQTNNINIYEAWVRLSAKNGLFTQIGRQNLSYDDQRIFGADDWAMTAMSHDALKLGYEGNGHKLHIIGAYNQNPENMDGGSYFTGGIQHYKAMEALWYHYDLPKIPLGISAVFMNVGLQSSSDAKDTCTFQQQLVGTYISYKPKHWTAEAAFYYQMGKEENGLPLGAWMTSLKTTYTPNDSWSFYGGYDYLSGDKNFAVPPKGMIGVIRHEKVHGFSSLNGSHHKFYGAMDFFYMTTYVSGFTPGLQNLYFGSKWNPLKKLTIDLSYHYLSTATSLKENKQSLGHELELAVDYQLMKDVNISAGYSFMRGTETMKALKRTSDNRQLQWGWLMLSVSPKLFSTIW